MKNSKKIIQLLAIGPVIIIPAIVFFVSSLIIESENNTYQRAMEQVKVDYLETEKSRIRSKVDNMVDLVSYRQSIINQKLHDRIQSRVDDARRIGLSLYHYYVNKLPEAEVKKMIVEALRPLVWNSGESFIWILDFDGNFQLAPEYLTDLEGTSILDFKDATGRKIIREEIAITKNRGSGFLWDTFTKPNESTKKQFKQLAYVQKFGIYNWYLGSAEYLDTARKHTNRELLEAINQVGKGDSSYFYVVGSQGNVLANNGNTGIVNQNALQSTELSIRGIYHKILKRANSKKSNFISYHWINPATGLIEKKMAYVKKVPNSDWIIGSGFYPDSIENKIDTRAYYIKMQHEQILRHLNKITWFSMLIAVIVSVFMSLMFYRVFINYQDGMLHINNELKDNNIELENQVLEKNKELNRLKLKLDVMAAKDDVTQTANRSLLMSRIVEVMNRTNRFNEPFSVLILDIENLKKVYEEKGYPFGDEILQSSAVIIGNQLRSVDLFGRYVGEEFLIVMPNTLIEDAYLRAKKIHYAIKTNDFNLDYPLALRIGVVQYEKGQNLSELVKALHISLNRASESADNKIYKYQ
ncbi:hypothetical protein JCM30760_09450 [Thiomicrorhabdus hydrogeniphila]